MSEFDPLFVAVRVYATPAKEVDEQPVRPARRGRQRTEPHRSLIIDTETTVDASQRLNFGVWRYYVDRRNGLPGCFCVEEGIFYSDDLPERDPEGFAVLQAYVESQRADVAPGRNVRLRFLSQAQFVETALWGRAFEQRATVAGFNLPFDVTRLALGASPARARKRNTTYVGGHSLRFWDRETFRPRIDVKALDAKRTLMGFTGANQARRSYRGQFLDLRTLSFALTDRSFSLEDACAAFGVPYTKRSVTHGTISDEYITYCREDVAATAQLLRATITEFHRHPINLEETMAFSPASIGKAYLKALGTRPILDRQPDFDPHVLGWGMAAFFGGPAECRIRKVPLPVVYVDFLSMYPTVNSLMGSWRLVTAERIAVDDATAKVDKLLHSADLFQQCFDKAFWPELLCLVEIEPDGDLLPVRAAYDPVGADYGIGVNPYRSDGSAWYALADLVAAVVTTGRVPTVRRAIALRPVGRERALTPIHVRGEIAVDPVEEDFFTRVIELRKEVDADLRRPEVERQRLSRFLKILTNATSYGILAEYVPQERHDPLPVTVYGDGPDPFTTSARTPERPGPFCFPPLAACITAGARLMLALLERCVTDAGGSYVFCDTDSMGIVADAPGQLYPCPGGPHQHPDGGAVRALSWSTVDTIVARFAALNPYDPTLVPGSILKIEKENFDHHGRRRQLWCWAISAKRYVLYTLGVDGLALRRIVDTHDEAGPDDVSEMAKVSEHGLGHLRDPIDADDPIHGWITQAWDYLLRQALGLPATKPAWLNRPALTRVTASSPTVLRWFDGFNTGKPYAEQIKPANFLLLAHPDPLDPSGALPIAPYESDASEWEGLSWIDRRTGQPVRITTEPADGNERPGVVQVRTYGQVLVDYVAHPEPKSLGPAGEPVGRHTVGLLRRRPVQRVGPPKYIGKEGNRLDDGITGLVTSADDYRTEYTDPSRTVWSEQIVPVLRTMDRRLLRAHSVLHRRSIERYLYDGVIPRDTHRAALTTLAEHHATDTLTAWGVPVPRTPQVLLHRYLQERSNRMPRCRACTKELQGQHRVWCNEACRSSGRAQK